MLKKVSVWITSVLMVFLTIIALFFLYQRITGVNPSAFGYHIFNVITGSMEPELEIGDVILCKSVPPEQLKKGDTITYTGKEGNFAGVLVTHKIIKQPEKTESGYKLQTQGVAEGTLPDPEITDDQVVGVMVTKLVVIGFLYRGFQTPWGLILFLIPITIVLVTEICKLIELIRKKENEND